MWTDAYFIIAMDNDRSPEHPEHWQRENLSKQDARKVCRYCEILATITDELGKDRTKWPIKGAIAVPVEMLESWLLLICKSERPPLPRFARKTQSIAQKYYAPHSVPDQLKELCRYEQDELGISSFTELCLHCAHALDPQQLESLSPSFALFKTQVKAWF